MAVPLKKRLQKILNISNTEVYTFLNFSNKKDKIFLENIIRNSTKYTPDYLNSSRSKSMVYCNVISMTRTKTSPMYIMYYSIMSIVNQLHFQLNLLNATFIGPKFCIWIIRKVITIVTVSPFQWPNPNGVGTYIQMIQYYIQVQYTHNTIINQPGDHVYSIITPFPFPYL